MQQTCCLTQHLSNWWMHPAPTSHLLLYLDTFRLVLQSGASPASGLSNSNRQLNAAYLTFSPMVVTTHHKEPGLSPKSPNRGLAHSA